VQTINTFYNVRTSLKMRYAKRIKRETNGHKNKRKRNTTLYTRVALRWTSEMSYCVAAVRQFVAAVSDRMSCACNAEIHDYQTIPSRYRETRRKRVQNAFGTTLVQYYHYYYVFHTFRRTIIYVIYCYHSVIFREQKQSYDYV